MTMKTAKVGLTARGGCDLIDALRGIEWPWEMRHKTTNLVTGAHTFEIWIDALPSVHELTLHVNGAWDMTTHVEI